MSLKIQKHEYMFYWNKEVPITFLFLPFSASGCKTNCVLIPSLKGLDVW